MPLRADDETYLAALDMALERIDDEAGSMLVVSLGFDTYERDPIGDLALTTDDYARIGAMIAGLNRPTVLLQEGGYAIDAIGVNAVSFLSRFGA